MSHFVVNKDWASYLINLRRNGTWADHIAVWAVATFLSYNIRIISSAVGTGDCFDIIVEPNGHTARHAIPLLLGHDAENHYESLDIAINGMFESTISTKTDCPLINR